MLNLPDLKKETVGVKLNYVFNLLNSDINGLSQKEIKTLFFRLTNYHQGKLKRISSQEFKIYKTLLDNQIKPGTVISWFHTLDDFSKRGIARTRKINRLIGEQEMVLLLNSMKDKYKTLLTIAFLQGFRIGEALKLNIMEEGNVVNIKEGFVKLERQKNGNDGEIVILRDSAKKILNDYVNRNYEKIRDNKGYLFWSSWRKGKPITYSSIATTMHHHRKKLGLDNEIYGHYRNGYKMHRITLHSARHYFIMDTIDRMVDKLGYIDQRSLQVLTRHKNPMSLNSYINITKKIKQKLTHTLLN